jgi:uncharacterized protein YjiK
MTGPSGLSAATRAVAQLLPVAVLASSGPLSARGDGAALDSFDLRRDAAVQARLPQPLREISGLAVTADGRVLAHGDEVGVVFEIDGGTGTVRKSFSLGGPPVPDDFEGVAVAGKRVFLITSAGRLYETREGDGRVPYTAYDTGLGARCEIEGLAYEPSDRTLLVGCKVPRDPTLRGMVTILRWSLDRRAPATPAQISAPLAEVSAVSGTKQFHPSSVEREPGTGHYVVVAGPERAVVEITPAGEVVAGRRLSGQLHRQPEGLTFLGDSLLLIADEGAGRHGTLTAYPRAP